MECVDLRKLQGKARLVTDVSGLLKDVQVVLRDTIKTWGVEVMQVLWKVLMVQSQTIENRLFDNFPEAAVLTDAERRYCDQVERGSLWTRWRPIIRPSRGHGD